MVKKTALLLSALLLPGALCPAAVNPWSNLKKIYLYDSSGDMGAVRENLDHMDIRALPPGEKIELLQKLNELGDRHFREQNLALAEAFYRRIIQLSPEDSWPLYNKLERIRGRQGRRLWDFGNIGRQFGLVARDFSSTFMMLHTAVNVFFFSSLLLFFLTVIVLFLKYFKLVTHDFILSGTSVFQVRRLVFLLLLLLWPLAFLGGWGYYPFLFCGFMWVYFDPAEKRNIRRIMIIVLAATLGCSVGNYLEKSLQSPGFQTIKNIYAGRLYPESVHARLDNETKVMQAHAYYEQRHPEQALDILLSTGNNYQSVMKWNLLGNIYLQKGNVAQSIQFYRQSLSMDNQNQVTLRNFTLALQKNDDPDSFELYQKSYPDIQKYKGQVAVPQTGRLPEKFLWQRLLSFSRRNFSAIGFLSHVTVEFLKFPVLLALLLMFVYISLLKKLLPDLGQSTFCNKCSKIIKKKSLEHAHPLCEDCYQLFLIKDPIFLEAKIIKEREINRKSRFKYSMSLIVSLFVPGFALNLKNRSGLFSLMFLLFFNSFGFYLFIALAFKGFIGTVPMFVNLIGMAAVVLYLAINALSLRGDDHGF
jgi:tetratricopeptide (TPR) repeat protein